MRLIRFAPAVVIGLVLAVMPAGPAGAEDTVDEIHFSYGDVPGSVVMNWRGAETSISYGLTEAYGLQAVAAPSAITPVDSAGPYQEVVLTGLAPDSAYHYRIGAGGVDHVLRTAPTGTFRWVDVGDTASTACKPWVAQTHALIAQLAPRFVTHGGDISEANICGTAAVHAYYNDQMAWSTEAAFQPVWGNHEYGNPNAESPAGTPRDSLANYKGRGWVTHGQAVSIDVPTQVTAPGCAGTTNTCLGEDWGWFRAGGVVFISYPEIWPKALASWQPAADALMAEAQADPTVDFIVTYGHRPAYSSLTANGWDPTIRAAVDALAAKYSPAAARPTGKYVLNLAHHVHALEVLGPINGLTHVTNATGGQGTVSLPTPYAPESQIRFRHLGVLAGDYDAAAHQLTLRWVCGPPFIPAKDDVCGYGDTVWTTTFTGPAPSPSPSPTPTPSPSVPTGPTAPPVPPKQWVLNSGLEKDLTGWSGLYGASPKVGVARVTAEARTGKAAIKVLGKTGAKDLTSGFNDDPRWVTRTGAGAAYTASAWVRPKAAGQEVAVRLKEWSAAGALVADKTTVVVTRAGWQQVSAQVTTAKAGGSLSMAVYARDLDAGEWFLADDLSLTSS